MDGIDRSKLPLLERLHCDAITLQQPFDRITKVGREQPLIATVASVALLILFYIDSKSPVSLGIRTGFFFSVKLPIGPINLTLLSIVLIGVVAGKVLGMGIAAVTPPPSTKTVFTV